MTSDEFNAFCRALPGTTHVVQWGGSDVWKVGGKLFAIGVSADGRHAVTFKAGPLAYEMLKDHPGLRPAPYLASRGLKWIQHYDEPGLTRTELEDYLRHSYRLVVEGLPKRTRASLDASAGSETRYAMPSQDDDSKRRPIDTSSPEFLARAKARRETWSLKVHKNFADIKAAEYRSWATLSDPVKFTTISELSAAAFALKGIHVQRLPRPHRTPE